MDVPIRKFHKALCRCLRSALLFYENLVVELRLRGFIINLHDPCVANMMSKGNHMTITWHFDDLKIFHIDADELTKLIYWMKGIYGSHIK